MFANCVFLVRINKRVIGDYLGEREASSERLGKKPCPVCHVQFLLFSLGNSVTVYPV